MGLFTKIRDAIFYKETSSQRFFTNFLIAVVSELHDKTHADSLTSKKINLIVCHMLRANNYGLNEYQVNNLKHASLRACSWIIASEEFQQLVKKLKPVVEALMNENESITAEAEKLILQFNDYFENIGISFESEPPDLKKLFHLK